MTVTALSALTAVLVALEGPTHVGSPLASPVPQQPARSSGAVQPDQPLRVVSGLSSNSHGAPHPSARSALATAPDLRPELQSAYWLAVHSAPPTCHPSFSLLAAIGMVESGSLEGRSVGSDNRVSPALIGPALDGKGHPSVRDTDAGRLDHDPVWDRAVGPMQLVPQVWRAAAVDMDGEGTRDPQNVFDAAGAAMVYLCAENRDLSTDRGVRHAVRAYNHWPGYVRLVLAWKAVYDRMEDQLVDLQGILGSVSPFPMTSQGHFPQALLPRAPGPPHGRLQHSVTTGTQVAASIPVAPGPGTGPLAPTPAVAEPSPSRPSTTGPPDPTPNPPPPAAQPPAAGTTDPAPAPAPGATPHPSGPDPATGPAPTPAPVPAPSPVPAPEPAPTCDLPLEEAGSLDPSAAPTGLPAPCPGEVLPVDPPPAP